MTAAIKKTLSQILSAFGYSDYDMNIFKEVL